MQGPGRDSNQLALPAVSTGFMRVFAAYARRYVGKHFHAIRILKHRMPPIDSTRPLVIFLNHPAWWDPLICLLLARQCFPGRTAYAPIDAEMLQRYGFFKRLGFFGIEQRSTRGALKLVRTSRAILATSGNALWLTPQGRFGDVRERPSRFESGLGAIAVRQPDAAFVPLVLEYPFWSEPRPEVLAAFGTPIVPGDTRQGDADDWTNIFAAEMDTLLDEVSAFSCRRDPQEWAILNHGRSGVGLIYDTWQRLRARVRGERYSPEHHSGVDR
jgi:1-acyl-sn-glycerol-3-phosphate acyltransferase